MHHDGFVHLVAAHAHGTRVHDTRQRDDGHFRSTAADVHHHIGGRLLNGQVRADGGRHGLLDKIDFPGPGGLRRFLDRALFHLSDAGRHADHDARADKTAGIVHLGNEMAQHGLGHFKIGDDAVLHGPDGRNIAGRAPQHALGVGADGQHHIIAARILLDGHHGGFAQHNALSLHIDTGIGRSQVDGQVIGKHAQCKIHYF